MELIDYELWIFGKSFWKQEYLELSELGDKAHNEWLARRRKVTRDRAIWGFPR